jgi:hypothetical protein
VCLPSHADLERLRQRSSRTVGVLTVARHRLLRVNRITHDSSHNCAPVARQPVPDGVFERLPAGYRCGV